MAVGSNPLLRPILSSFNPTPHPLSAESSREMYHILSRHDRNSLTVKPSERNVPWFSTFPVCRQSIHWAEAERSAKYFLGNLYELSRLTGTRMPKQLDMNTDMKFVTKHDDLIETAVACTIFQHPNGNVARASLIAQAMLLLWLQDGKMKRVQIRPSLLC